MSYQVTVRRGLLRQKVTVVRRLSHTAPLYFVCHRHPEVSLTDQVHELLDSPPTDTTRWLIQGQWFQVAVECPGDNGYKPHPVVVDGYWWEIEEVVK